MENFIAHLKEVIPEKDSLKLVKKEAENYYKQHSLDECFATGLELYQSENFQIQEVGVFLVGYAACKNTSALSFLKDTVSQHKSWKVQEILAMAFDNYCKIIGYETAIATVYKGNIIKNLIMDCQSYTKYRPNETTGGIFVSWRRKEELPTGA